MIWAVFDLWAGSTWTRGFEDHGPFSSEARAAIFVLKGAVVGALEI